MKTAYSFIRWSSKRQGQESRDSERRQKNSAENWCKENGFVLDKQAFIGAGESAYKGKHLKTKDGVAIGALARFIEAVESNEIKAGSALCIDSVDRFSRQEIMKTLSPFTKLLDLGIGIVFTGSYHKKLITNELLNKEPHWLQVLLNDMIRSWMESDEKSRKIKKAKESKRDDLIAGKIVTHNNAPKYYTWNKESKKYEHNEKTLLVKRIVQMFIDGNTLYSIARTLNSEKIPTIKTNTSWSGNTIRSILKNRALIGEFLGAKNFFPPIVDDQTFHRIQAILSQNPSFNKGKPGRLANVFRGIAFCECGRRMCVLSQTKNPHTKKPHEDPFKYRYLRCNSQGTGKNCDQTYVMPLREMEEEFFVYFLMRDPKEMVASKSELKEIQGEIAQIQLAISSLDKAIKDAANLIGSDIAVDAIKAKLIELETSKSEKQSQMDKLNAQLSHMQLLPKHFDDIKKLHANFGPVNLDENLMWKHGPGSKPFWDAVARINETLRDNEVRKKIKIILPTLIGKIVVDTPYKRFEVFNHQGKSIYKSRMFYTEE